MQIEIASPYDKMSESGSSLLKLIQNNNTSKLDLLVRESLQNCLDAGDKTSEYVDVDFITGSTETNRVSSFFDMIEDNLNKECGNTCDFIAIRDTNTVGLTGPVRKADIGSDGKYGNYLKLVTEISKPQEQHGAGGSWGLGKTVYFRIGIGLVVYYSRIRKESGSYESRLSAALVEDERKGNSILPSDGKGLKRGIAWWGEIDKYDETGKSTIPVTDESIVNDIISKFGVAPFNGTETGTIILIPFIDRDQLLKETIPTGNDKEYQVPYWCKTNIEDYLKIAIQRWYAPRIQNTEYRGQYLNVRINGNRITYEKMAPIFRLIQTLYNATPKNGSEFNGKPITSKGVELRNAFQKGNAQSGLVNYLKVTSEDLKMTAPDNLPKPYYYIDKWNSDTMYNDPIVMFTRKPGMIVSYNTTGDWTDSIPKCEVGEYIVAIFVANSENRLSQTNMSLEEYIRGSEKADHKAWEDWVIPGGNPQIIQRIKRGVRKKIKDDFSVMTVGKEERKNLGLGKMLADLLLPPTDFSYWDDAIGGTSGPGGTGGDGSSPSGNNGGGSVNNTSHVILKQTGAPRFKLDEIEMPVRILFGKQKSAILEIAIAAEGKTISSAEWEKIFDSSCPAVLKGFKIISASKGKGKDYAELISDEIDILSDSNINGIHFTFEKTDIAKRMKSIRITTSAPDNYVVDGIIRYSLDDVQGTIVLKEEA